MELERPNRRGRSLHRERRRQEHAARSVTAVARRRSRPVHTSLAALCAGPGGRLWVASGDANDGIFVTRSNRAANAFEPISEASVPRQAQRAHVRTVRGLGRDRLICLRNSTARVSGTRTCSPGSQSAPGGEPRQGDDFLVRDAGDPVSGAAISVGGRHLKTGANGAVSLRLRKGSYSVSASVPGYATATAAFQV